MAITYVGAGTPHDRSSTSTTDFTMGVPAGIAAGDLLLAFITGPNGIGSAVPTPTGWTLLLSQGDNGSNGRQMIYYRVAVASEPSTYSWSTQGNSYGRAGVIVAYRGAAVPTVYTGSFINNGSANATAPQITTTQTANYVLSSWSMYTGQSNISFGAPSSDFASRYNTAAVANSSAILEVVDRLQPPAGASQQPTVLISPASGPPVAQMATIAIPIYNTAPTAPTPGAPASNSSVNRTQPVDFTWTPADADAGDSQTAFDLQYRPVGSSTWTTVSQTTSTNAWTAPAGTFTNSTQYEWQVRTTDALGAVGPYCAAQQFLAATPQAAPTINAPASGSTVSAPSTSLTFTAANATASQWRVMGDTSGSANSTVVLAGETTNDGSVRAFTVSPLPNNITAHFQVRVLYQGLWSPWADRSVPVAFTLPAVPIATLALAPNDGLTVTWTTPTPTGGQPTVVTSEVWVDDDTGEGSTRRVTGLPPSGSWTYPLPRTQCDYAAAKVRVRSLAATGAASSGAATAP